METKRKAGRFWVKFVVFALAVLVATAGVFSALGTYWCAQEGFYQDEHPDILAACGVWELVCSDVARMSQSISQGDMDGALKIAREMDFAAVLSKESGEQVWSNRSREEGELAFVSHLGNYDGMHPQGTDILAPTAKAEKNYTAGRTDMTGVEQPSPAVEESQAQGQRYVLSLYTKPGVDYGALLGWKYDFVAWAAAKRNLFLFGTAGCCLLLVALTVCLMRMAGWRETGEKPECGWQEEIALEIYLALDIVLGGGFCLFVQAVSDSSIWQLVVSALAACIMGIASLALALMMTLAVRVKTHVLWKRTLTYSVLRGIGRFFAMLPLVWKGVALLIAAVLVNLFFLSAMINGIGAVILLAMVMDGILLYAYVHILWQMRKLHVGAQALAQGRLDYNVDTSRMKWEFKAHGEALNGIRDGMAKAVNERLKSERFKTDLITNVSHDLKTPLTSIVSYVDLLKKLDVSPESAREYVEVLDRQSARLKKLTEDLVEASKASSGAISVNLERLCATELLEQCLGEYADRLEKAGVVPVMGANGKDIWILADGRLLWRVLDNLIGNVVKYAMPGTRAYFDVMATGATAEISVKNISRAPLNLSAEQLMERFVRGDAARSGEGSGLGLSIAASLTECMGGRCVLLPDGDLFKVVLRFPVG